MWGTFRPGIYFGMKKRVPQASISSGIMWTSSLTQGDFRHDTKQDEVKFDWDMHDGKNFGVQQLIDKENNMQLETKFIVPGDGKY